MAVSVSGVVAVLVRDRHDLLRQDLRECFPYADLIEGDEVAGRYLKHVLNYLEHPAVGIQIPLDMRGTAFQRKVWNHLLTLKVDEMTTYADVARDIGAPRAMRAVGTTCASNGNVALSLKFANRFSKLRITGYINPKSSV